MFFSYIKIKVGTARKQKWEVGSGSFILPVLLSLFPTMIYSSQEVDMQNTFDICGTPIPYDRIKSYRIIQREYIYRPAYKEKEAGLLSVLSGQKYEFLKMVPYAAILSDDEYKHAIKNAKANSVKESLAKDLAVGLVSTIGSKFNIKEFKSKKYKCINVAGRTFETYLEDIPATILRKDGRISDVRKDDELYHLLGEPISPAVLIVPALQIVTKEETFVFYGNGIQLNDLELPYRNLKETLEYRSTMHPQIADKKRLHRLPFAKK